MLCFFFPEHLSWWILSLQYQPDNWKLSHWTASISNLWERFSLIIIRKKCKRVKTAMNYIWKAFSFFLLSGKKIVCYKTKHQPTVFQYSLLNNFSQQTTWIGHIWKRLANSLFFFCMMFLDDISHHPAQNKGLSIFFHK